MNKTDKIHIAGHRGMVGSAILRNLEDKGFVNIIIRTSSELDLSDTVAVANFFGVEKANYVFFSSSQSWWDCSKQYLSC